MKQSKKLKIAAEVLLICITFIFSSCAVNSEGVGCESENTNSIAGLRSEAQYKISDQAVCNKSDTDDISLFIPRLESDNEDFAAVNNLIFQQVCGYFSEFDINDLKITDDLSSDSKNENSEQTSLSGEYQIKYNDDKKLSFVLFGVLNDKSAAHPTHYSFGVNIDLQNSQVIDVKSIYDFSDDFSKMLYSNRENLLVDSKQKDAVISYLDIQKIRECLNNGTKQFYFTENKIGIIQDGLPYALGDYCIIEIAFDSIKQFELN